MTVLVVRFDAPLVSFGGPTVDQNGVVKPFPALSMVTGLLANALGWDRRDHEKLARLQDRIRLAARVDRRGQALVDYQTVDLGAPWMRAENSGWTTRGVIAERGGASSDTTHQRYRHYRADSLHTVVLTLSGDEQPSIQVVASALREPSRPLFVGRKCCLPAGPLLIAEMESDSLVGALNSVPRANRADKGPLRAVWPADEEPVQGADDSRPIAVADERDWRSSVHVGRRVIHEGHVNPPDANHA